MNKTLVIDSQRRNSEHFQSATIETLFHTTFYREYQTRLYGGAAEPLYEPEKYNETTQRREHCIYYRDNYFASALHEVAHWCLAGEQRRRQIDFGYWYYPEGRSADQQQRFLDAEVKPQAIELLFSIASGYFFQPSMDDFSVSATQRSAYQQTITEQALHYCRHGLPPRAETFYVALATYYDGPAAKELESVLMNYAEYAEKDTSL